MKRSHLFIFVLFAAAAALGAKRSCSCHCSTATVKDIVLSGDLDRSKVEAKDIRSTFAPDHPKIYCVMVYKYAPKETTLEITWRFLGGPSGSPAATRIDGTKKEINGSGRLAFSLKKPTKGWPEGKYEVEVELNGKTVKKLPFEIKKK